MSEEEIFDSFMSLNPFPGKKMTDWKIGKGQKIKIKLYKWMTLSGKEMYVSISRFSRLVPDLCKVAVTSQIYFDVIVLGITDLKERPKCINCGKFSRFIGLGERGYLKTCSHNCDMALKSARIEKEGKKLKNLSKSKEQIRKIVQTKSTDEYKRKVSESIKNFYKTPLGEERRKKISETIRRRNLDDISTGKFFKRKGRYKKGFFITKSKSSLGYDSSWVMDFLKHLDNAWYSEDIKRVTRCTDRIQYYDNNDKKFRIYIPDFTIVFKSGMKLVVEIKPLSYIKYDSVTRQKYIAAKKFYRKNNIKYIVLTEVELYFTRRNKSYRNKSGLKKSFSLYDYII